MTAAVAAWYVRGMQRRTSEIVSNNVASVLAAQELETSIREIDARLDRYLLGGGRQNLEAIPNLRRRAADALAAAESLAFTSEEQALTSRVRAGCDALFAVCDRLLAGRPDHELRPDVGGASGIPEREILGPARLYRELNERMLSESSQANEQVADRLTVGLLALGGCGAGGGLVGGWVFATGVRRAMGRTEARLRRTEQDALRAEQLAWVGQMAAGVAHEVRNPLAAIKLLVQAAADPARETPFRGRDLDVLEREIDRLEGTVSGFLDFARPPRPDKKLLDLRAILQEVAEGLMPCATRQRVAIQVDVTGSVFLAADPNQLRQLVYNLTLNALDAQPRGGEVRLTAAAVSERPPAVEVRVEDRGPGVPTELGARAFDPFVSGKPTGMGLGLSICRRIAEAHGGTIRADERPGGGAAFAVNLPLLPVPTTTE